MRKNVKVVSKARDNDLLELKIRLEGRLESLQDAIYTIQSGIKEMGAMKLQENADIISTQSQVRVNDSTFAKYKVEIKDIESSLKKFKNNVYGVCKMCDVDIDIDRLSAKPHARFCINCREIYEEQEKRKAKLQKTRR